MGNNHSRPRTTYETRKRCKYPFLHWRRLCHNDSWCKCDARRLTKGWTSGHPGLNKFIKETQRSTREWMDPYLVWIPYDQLSNIKTIGEGGFSITYSAEWCDMAKRFSWAATGKSRPVALRLIKDSKDMSTSFLDELRVYHKCISNPPMFDGEVKYDHGFLRFFGFTQHPETKDYIMVTELAPCRDIRYLLQKNFLTLCWSDKLYWLRNIAGNLVTIHESGYAHRNLHPGNILMGQIKDGVTVAKLAHLGLSRPATNVSSKDFYGVLPYIAPEVLLGQQYTKAADIYSIGIIMVELSSGIPPFFDRVHDEKLALDIVNGLRPEFAEGTPTSYIELAQQCFKSNPSERPKARDLLYMFNHWWDITQDPEILDDIFSNADKIISALDNSFTKHPEAIYKSRLINFKRLLNKGKEDNNKERLEIID